MSDAEEREGHFRVPYLPTYKDEILIVITRAAIATLEIHNPPAIHNYHPGITSLERIMIATLASVPCSCHMQYHVRTEGRGLGSCCNGLEFCFCSVFLPNCAVNTRHLDTS